MGAIGVERHLHRIRKLMGSHGEACRCRPPARVGRGCHIATPVGDARPRHGAARLVKGGAAGKGANGAVVAQRLIIERRLGHQLAVARQRLRGLGAALLKDGKGMRAGQSDRLEHGEHELPLERVGEVLPLSLSGISPQLKRIWRRGGSHTCRLAEQGEHGYRLARAWLVRKHSTTPLRIGFALQQKGERCTLMRIEPKLDAWIRACCSFSHCCACHGQRSRVPCCQPPQDVHERVRVNDSAVRTEVAGCLRRYGSLHLSQRGEDSGYERHLLRLWTARAVDVAAVQSREASGVGIFLVVVTYCTYVGSVSFVLGRLAACCPWGGHGLFPNLQSPM